MRPHSKQLGQEDAAVLEATPVRYEGGTQVSASVLLRPSDFLVSFPAFCCLICLGLDERVRAAAIAPRPRLATFRCRRRPSIPSPAARGNRGGCWPPAPVGFPRRRPPCCTTPRTPAWPRHENA